MYIVTVTFTVNDDHVEDFKAAVLNQARQSLEREEHCLRFDVAMNAEVADSFFLYEIYTDSDAFSSHLDSEHFASFAALTESWVSSKKVETWNAIEAVQ